MTETFVVTATPPTPNGDFHVGHLSGPYLGADIFTRYQRMRGANVLYVSSADTNQSYVVTTAERKGRDPFALAASCHREMVTTLADGRIAVDAFNEPDARHSALVQDFMRVVDQRGHVKRKIKRLPFSNAEGRFLFESFVAGHCPECWAPTAGAICETCGHPNDSASLELSRAARSVEPLAYRDVEIAVLEMETFRPQLERFYREKRGSWRPHVVEFVFEMLARPLPDYPLTYPSDWGIPAPFAGCEGQVVNVWAEMLPGLVNSTAEAIHLAGGAREAGAAMWRAESPARLVQFLGFDNSFFFAMVHPVLAWAHGDCKIVDTILTNEFFELDHFKFSTSKNHLIWARDLLLERPVDLVRYHLALANPEHQKSNFSREAMDVLVNVRLLVPFSDALDGLARAGAHLKCIDTPLQADAATAVRLERVLSRFARFHEIETFSPQRIAEHLSQLLVRISAGARHIVEGRLSPVEACAEYAFLAGAVRVVLPAAASPLMPDFARRLAVALEAGDACRWPDALEGVSLRLGAESLAAARQILLPDQVELRRAS